MCYRSSDWYGFSRLYLHHERKLDCLPSTTRSKITTLEDKRVKIYSSADSICHRIPKFSSSNALQLINWDLILEFSTFNSQSPARNKSSTQGMKNLTKWFGETEKKGIHTSPNHGICLCFFKWCIDTLHKVGGKMILSLESCAWNPSSCSILHFHLDLCPRTESIMH